MLFYNHEQKFIGIDEEGLKLLNYTTFEDLLGVCGDVADLFAKEPGYIHNFKNFGWIDFLLHAESDATSAIVHGNGRTFSCTLAVQKLFLADNPAANGYIIDMTHVKSLSGEEIKPHTITPQPLPEKAPVVAETTVPEPEISSSAFPDYAHLTPTLLSEPDTLDVPSFPEEDFTLPSFEEEVHDEIIPSDDLYPNLAVPFTEEELPLEEVPAAAAPQPSQRPAIPDIRYSAAEREFIDRLKTDLSYRFNPQVAADELGLPVDLIEEFIGDFIQQSHDFKDELFEAALKGDMNNLRILSHKLKGVAANLRIEDALEALTNINTSNDSVEIEANLKYFYAIIDKLEGKGTASSGAADNKEDIYSKAEPKTEAEPLQEKDTDIYHFSLKQNDDEPLMVQEKELSVSTDLSDETYGTDIFKSSEEEPLLVHAEEPVKFIDLADETYGTDIFKIPEEEPLVLSDEITSFDAPAVVGEPEAKLHYDTAANAGALGIELPFFQELLGDYKREATGAAGRISSAIASFDTHSWKKTASDLKGISDNLRLTEISDQLAVLSQTNDAQEANKASKLLISFIAQL